VTLAYRLGGEEESALWAGDSVGLNHGGEELPIAGGLEKAIENRKTVYEECYNGVGSPVGWKNAS